MSRKEPELFTIDETDFKNAYARIVGYNLKFGFESNGAYENIITMRLSGNAISQVLNKETHPLFPNKIQFIESYCNQYTYEFLEEYLQRPEIEKFVYLYFERLARYPIGDGTYFDQIQALHDNLRDTTNSRQLVMSTWIPHIDSQSKEPPCLQNIQIRQIAPNLVDFHYLFRSWDVGIASPTNIIAITTMLKKYVTKDDYKINSITITARSGHCYLNDLTLLSTIKQIPTIR